MSVEQQARSDTRKKLKLEKRIIKKLKALNNKIVRSFVLAYGKNGEIINASRFFDGYESLLINHYEVTGDEFNSDISEKLPEELEETNEERALILATLALFYNDRSPRQTGRILTTTQKNINQSLVDGIKTTVEGSLPGSFPSRRDIARNAGISLKRKLNGRNTGIASTETQAIAEEAKQVEAEVLTLGAPEQPDKEWVTKGDEVVRRSPFSHVAADGQKIKLDETFEVGGESLKMPGDDSHGASLANIIECRCASVVDFDSVVNARKFIFDQETRLSAETVVSIPEFAF